MINNTTIYIYIYTRFCVEPFICKLACTDRRACRVLHGAHDDDVQGEKMHMATIPIVRPAGGDKGGWFGWYG
jgi:hypothetical protein